jgi:hypothetical protein
MFLMAEEGDNWNSNDAVGEQHNGDLADPAYLVQMRDSLFPSLVPYTAALLDYFESLAPPSPSHQVFLPTVQR